MLAAGTIPLEAYSQVFLSEEQSVKAIFPGETLRKKTFELSKDEARKIADLTGERVRTNSITAYVGAGKNVVFIDQVLGKHEYITYAVGVNKDGTVKGVEILVYRETYGQQVQGENWRKQFDGKNLHSPLKMNDDIQNISGATLSSTHITGGVKRLLQTYETIRERI